MSTDTDSRRLDVTAVRAAFPALKRSVAGRPAVYLDGPGGSQAPAAVIEAMARYLRGGIANDGGVFVTSRETDALVDDARAAMADFLGTSPEEIVLGANATTLNFLLAHAVARTLRPGDEILITRLDHDANRSPWQAVAADHRLRVRDVPILAGEVGIDLDALEALMSERTRVVAFTLASNAVGSIPDVARIVSAAHAHGALAWADGVHLAPHRPVRRAELDLDVVLCSPYKFFGPHLGVAAVRAELARSWPADRVRAAADTPAGHRLETGTVSHEALAGTVTAIAYLEQLGGGGVSRRERLDDAYHAIRVHEDALSSRFLTAIPRLPGVTLHGVADPSRTANRTPTFCLTVPGRSPRAVCEHLARRGIFAWDGNFYASSLIDALGLAPEGGVRVGFLHYTSDEDVDRLLDALGDLTATGGA